ncbi:PLP-dependent aminotransferase family protein [Sphaerisporangium sp. TRM90804]|uniref:aminotransferase-like domain-containing protein n=1 Tax=Sphaerisporangium sp. TRM90804 TaxID=3031113 RepID=UPI002447D1A7|nr:PLP-dependent aminotransferase family protein [Sphaerisporangium sp. TRM90804]MDH2429819.1 PLP-dependent aminotransferase family protein [Sphaerisporangium sp. TRM90804]
MSEVIASFAGWATGTGPLYRRLADGIRAAAENGLLLPGERIPAERQLATALRVSRTTVVAAYEALRDAGVIESRRGSGTRIAGDLRVPAGVDGRVPGGTATALFQHLLNRSDGVISLACAAEGAVPELAETLRDLAAGDLSDLLEDPGYHPSGLPELREAVAAHMTATGLPTVPEQILITTGAHQALVLVTELYLGPGRAVLTESPSWPGCLDVFRSRGTRILTAPMDAEGVDVGAVAATLDADRPGLIFVMPTYHNPTGVLMSAARRRRLAEVAARYDVPVLEDNAYTAETGMGDRPAPVAAYAPRGAEVLSVGSLAKVVWAGLRIGWVRGPSEIIQRLARRKALADLGSAVLDQKLAARLIPRIDRIQAARAPERECRLDHMEKLLRERLPGWRWRRPDGGSGLWIELPGVDATDFAQVALRHGVEVVPGATTDPAGGHRRFIRVPFTFSPELIDLLVDRLVFAWAEFERHGPVDTGPTRVIV